tara:strand:+ start:52 stop:621 length:570 start_codon:yes stop_codon:yes gene_type:complete
MTLEELKQIVNKSYGFDISQRKRTRPYCYARKVYCKIGRHMGFTLYAIGDSINISHATVLYHLKSFSCIEPSDLEIYEKIKELCYNPEEMKEFNDSLKNDNKLYEHKISKLMAEIHLLKTNISSKSPKQNKINYVLDVFNKWSEETLSEFIDTRLNIFDKMISVKVSPKEVNNVIGAKVEGRVSNPFLK